MLCVMILAKEHFGCLFRFNGPLKQYFGLYRVVSQRGGERIEMIDETKQMSKPPNPHQLQAQRPLPYYDPN